MLGTWLQIDFILEFNKFCDKMSTLFPSDDYSFWDMRKYSNFFGSRISDVSSVVLLGHHTEKLETSMRGKPPFTIKLADFDLKTKLAVGKLTWMANSLYAIKLSSLLIWTSSKNTHEFRDNRQHILYTARLHQHKVLISCN